MTGKREAKREELKSRLIQAATNAIERDGIKGLNARAVAQEAGCALGSVYTVFEDLDDLAIHVNSQTLKQLASLLFKSSETTNAPEEKLKALARAYIAFAQNHYQLWNAVFEYADLTGYEIPDWYHEQLAQLIAFIGKPVSALSPSIDTEEASRRARTLFAAVHGIVSFSRQGRFVGLKDEELEPELMRFIDQLLLGLHHSQK